MGDLVNGQPLPTDINDPGVVKTPTGAMGAYYSAVLAFRAILDGQGLEVGVSQSYIGFSGLLTDELQASGALLTNTFPTAFGAAIDARSDEILNNYPYDGLQIVRARAREARGALRKYYPASSSALTGYLLAIEGMAEVLLAELYCSGIPLSTLDFEDGYTLQSGSSTEAVFQHALTLFDSALIVSTDSTNITNFTALGRARSLLGLHKVADAALAVRNIPTEYRHMLPVEGGYTNIFRVRNGEWFASVSDREGDVGLPFRTSGDPRSSSDLLASNGQWFPKKYRDAGTTDLSTNLGKVAAVFASGIEARLIEAEAALVTDDANWLKILNALRTSCLASTGCPIPAPAGAGGIAGLPVLGDPGIEVLPRGNTAEDVRLDLLFKERAYWLFLTGRRQADMRRLVQQYGREQQTVYPSGLWGRDGLVQYGSRISLPVPIREQQTNNLYHGCKGE